MTTSKRKLLQQKTPLIKRYVRLRMRQNGKVIARFIMRRVLQIKERKRRQALISTLAEFATQAAKSRRYGFESSAILFNLGFFFLIAERDIQAVKIDALTHPDAWERLLCARIILLTIHELDMDKVSGNKLREALADAGVSDESRQKSAQALRIIRGAQQKAQKQFAFLRNATIAHRDSDALLQYRTITEIDEMAVLPIVSEFYQGTHMFLSLLPDLLIQVGAMSGLFNQIRAQANRRK